MFVKNVVFYHIIVVVINKFVFIKKLFAKIFFFNFFFSLLKLLKIKKKKKIKIFF